MSRLLSSHFRFRMSRAGSVEEDANLALALRILRDGARPPPKRSASDSGDGDATDLAMQVLQARPMSRRRSLILARSAKAKRTKNRPSQGVQQRIGRYNKAVTRKRDELMCVGGKVIAPKCKHADHKKWTPVAMVRACFGEAFEAPSQARGATRMRLTRGVKRKRSQNRRVNPQARSTRGKADEYKVAGAASVHGARA